VAFPSDRTHRGLDRQRIHWSGNRLATWLCLCRDVLRSVPGAFRYSQVGARDRRAAYNMTRLYGLCAAPKVTEAVLHAQ